MGSSDGRFCRSGSSARPGMIIPLGWMYLTLGLTDRSQSPIQEINRFTVIFGFGI